MKRIARTSRPVRGRSSIASPEDRLIADRVKEWMQIRSLDAPALAQQLELKEEQLSRILKGEVSWSLSLLTHVAAALKVTETDLDAAFPLELRQDLARLELRADLPHLQTLHTFIRSLPQIRDLDDLKALQRMIEALASPRSTSE